MGRTTGETFRRSFKRGERLGKHFGSHSSAVNEQGNVSEATLALAATGPKFQKPLLPSQQADHVYRRVLDAWNFDCHKFLPIPTSV